MGVVADIVGSSGVFIVGVVTVTTHWPYADVVAAVFVAVWVVSWAKGNRLSRPSGQL
jgi:cobalt-zinc-cadmium efflux system protein